MSVGASSFAEVKKMSVADVRTEVRNCHVKPHPSQIRHGSAFSAEGEFPCRFRVPATELISRCRTSNGTCSAPNRRSPLSNRVPATKSFHPAQNRHYIAVKAGGGEGGSFTGSLHSPPGYFGTREVFGSRYCVPPQFSRADCHVWQWSALKNVWSTDEYITPFPTDQTTSCIIIFSLTVSVKERIEWPERN